MPISIRCNNNLSMAAFNDYDLKKSTYVAYGTVMFFILCLGLAGNLLSVPVLLHRDHRKKSVTPLMLNMCIVDILLCSIGYSISVSYNLVGEEMKEGDLLRCGWIAFINCFAGIVGIITLTLMSYVSYSGITTISTSQTNKISPKTKVMFISLVWIFAFVLSIPPAFGWSSFVPFQNGISCHPNWVSQDPADQSYIAFLVSFGFFIPIVIIMVCYFKTYRFIKTSTFPIGNNNDAIFKRQMETRKRMFRMTVAAVVVFFLSWAPYCIVSLMATSRGEPVLTGDLSLIPELMAKASVVYNPIVYTFMNAKFRLTLKNMLKMNYNAAGPSSTVIMTNPSNADIESVAME